MNTIDQARKNLREAIKQEAETLLGHEKVMQLIDEVRLFTDNPYKKGSARQFNEDGLLYSVIEIDNPLSKLDIDESVMIELIANITENYPCFILPNKKTITIETCLGDAVTINFSDTSRSCYAVYSSELGLKVNYLDLVGSDDSEKLSHALYLIELAMRKHGYYPYIVKVDYYVYVTKELSTDLGDLSDIELENHGKQFEVCDD